MPTLSQGIATTDHCSSPEIHLPRCGARLRASAHDVEMEVEVENRQEIVTAIGPLFFLFPVFHARTSATPLTMSVELSSREPFAFNPWEVFVQTDRGQRIAVSKVEADVISGRVTTVELDAREKGARRLDWRRWRHFRLTFERPIPFEQPFALTLQLKSENGADVEMPTINFKGGKVSVLGTVP